MLCNGSLKLAGSYREKSSTRFLCAFRSIPSTRPIAGRIKSRISQFLKASSTAKAKIRKFLFPNQSLIVVFPPAASSPGCVKHCTCLEALGGGGIEPGFPLRSTPGYEYFAPFGPGVGACSRNSRLPIQHCGGGRMRVRGVRKRGGRRTSPRPSPEYRRGSLIDVAYAGWRFGST
jgi:hypothetical protein